MAKLTQKQETFCLKFHETGNASEAYRYAYSCGKMKPETIRVKACELLKNGNVTVMLDELRLEAKERAQITVDDLLTELEENRQAALQAETVQSSAATAATMGKAKLLGLDKVIVEHSNPDGSLKAEITVNMNPQDAANAYKDLMEG
ncbi:MAG: terminase small subunit [Vibrio sp.]